MLGCGAHAAHERRAPSRAPAPWPTGSLSGGTGHKGRACMQAMRAQRRSAELNSAGTRRAGTACNCVHEHAHAASDSAGA